MAGDVGVWIGLISVVGGFSVLAAGFAGAYFIGKSRAQNETIRSGRDPELVARLARVEQIVESTALEVERISEGQRFTTKLLSERKTIGA
ncbi:MAG TPA: hypothetical protein VNO75_04740 [Gemmatimonadaceae bacterium]|nr:hypothetical protein [Gemmatimonadaceae bacterium]